MPRKRRTLTLGRGFWGACAAVLYLLACGTVGAAPEPGGEEAAEPEPFVAGEPFDLRVGEERRLEESDLHVRFDGVLGDSRCPRDVTCVWEGDAELEVTLRRDGESATVHLHTHGSQGMPREARALGHALRLEGLAPTPVSTRRIAPEEYVATLLLR